MDVAVGIPQPWAVANIIASVPIVAKTLGSKGLAAFWVGLFWGPLLYFLLGLPLCSAASLHPLLPSVYFHLLSLPVCSLTSLHCRCGYGCVPIAAGYLCLFATVSRGSAYFAAVYTAGSSVPFATWSANGSGLSYLQMSSSPLPCLF